ncbi:MAG TPA: Gfo/Idh/MocA family oxidoreductase [Opitutaceae bacterium]|nr:Gfo/Idh/MocA family oxidoreductase [Opitutaceae bacterium]
MNPTLDRRDFIKRSTLAGLGLGLSGSLASLLKAENVSPASAAAPAVGQSGSANNRVRLAVVGTNGRGLAHIDALGGIPNTEVVYVCDVEDGALAKGMDAAKKANFTAAKALKDFRKALEDPSIDAITVATPDHWHAPMAIMALAAGKHVYLEKPCSQNPYEGELLLQAIAKHKKLVQMGNQRRSFPNMHEAMKAIHEGAIGKAYYARCWYANDRVSIGRGKQVPVPANLDYDLWQGPAPRRPYMSNLIHYNWHWFWHWGTGEALNNGTHELDVCRWALNVRYPKKVTSTGGRYAFTDDWETPDTQVIGWEYDGKAISWEGRSCNGAHDNGLGRGSLIYGTEGTALLDGNSYTLYDAKRRVVKEVKEKAEAEGTNTLSASGIRLDRLHVENFISAIRDGVPLNSPIEEGSVSVTTLHLGNIAQRTNSTLHCDPQSGHILNNEAAMKLWRREYEPGWEPAI